MAKHNRAIWGSGPCTTLTYNGQNTSELCPRTGQKVERIQMLTLQDARLTDYPALANNNIHTSDAGHNKTNPDHDPLQGAATW